MTVKEIRVAQYDRLDFTFYPVNEDGTEYTLDEGDKWFFVVKTTPSGTVLKRITQTSTAFTWDSVELDTGVYEYEIGIRLADGTKKTIVPNEVVGEPHPHLVVASALEGEDDAD